MGAQLLTVVKTDVVSLIKWYQDLSCVKDAGLSFVLIYFSVC